MSETIHAGVAVVDITPAIGHDNLSDFMRLKPAEGVGDPLHARALVLSDGSTAFALVTADLLWFTGEIVETIRAGVERLTGIPGDHVIVNASHTHASAEVTPAYGASAEYIKELGKRVAGAIYMAWQALEPVQAGFGMGEAKISVNRWRPTDAGCEWAPSPNAPIDHQVGVLRLDRGDGTPLVILVNFPAHTSMLSSAVMKYSGDYAGFMAEAIAKVYDGKAMGMFLAGAGGDVKVSKPGPDGPEFVVADLAECKRYGVLLAGEAIKVAEGIRTAPVTSLGFATKSVNLPLVPPFPVERYEQEAAGIRAEDPVPPALEFVLEWAEQSARIVREGKPPTSLPVEVQMARIGSEIVLFATPGELFVEVGMGIKQALGVPGAFVAAYCNDTPRVGYLPSKRAASWRWCEIDHQLKYFTRPILPSNFSGEIEDVLVAAAREMAAGLRA